MSPLRERRPRKRLNGQALNQLRRQILARDGWRCQVCGNRTKLELHHKAPRSKLGDDSEENLITLCHPCHRNLHLEGKLSKRSLDDRPSWPPTLGIMVSGNLK